MRHNSLQEVNALVGIHSDGPDQDARAAEMDYRGIEVRMPVADLV
jgi:hypothetical protein